MTLSLGRLHHIIFYRTVLGCALFWCWVSLCVPFTNSLIQVYFITIVVIIIGIFIDNLFVMNYMFRLSLLSSSGSANAHFPGWNKSFLVVPIAQILSNQIIFHVQYFRIPLVNARKYWTFTSVTECDNWPLCFFFCILYAIWCIWYTRAVIWNVFQVFIDHKL